MFNPFSPLSPLLLQAFIKAGKKYFVRQAFNRGHDHFDEGIKGRFIFTHYSDAGHAQHHMEAINQDPYRYMYDWNEAEHQARLIIAASQPAGYKIYSAVFEKDWQHHVTSLLRQKAKKYVEGCLGWKSGRNKSVNFEIYANYGELYARFTLRKEEVRVKLEEIETIR